MMPNADFCPAEIVEDLKAWVNHGTPPGGFLEAVLTNDLQQAFGRADSINMWSMPHIVAYCWNKIPAECWGSVENVRGWQALMREKHEAGNSKDGRGNDHHHKDHPHT